MPSIAANSRFQQLWIRPGLQHLRIVVALEIGRITFVYGLAQPIERVAEVREDSKTLALKLHHKRHPIGRVVRGRDRSHQDRSESNLAARFEQLEIAQFANLTADHSVRPRRAIDWK